MKINYDCAFNKRSVSRMKGIGEVDSLPSHQLLWFLANIYLDPGFEPLISQRWIPRFYTLKVEVDSLPSHQLLWFLANIYLDPGFVSLISHPKVLSIRPPRW